MEGINFVAIDVETANADRASICQIGVVGFHEGQVADKWSTLVNPEDDFEPFNTSIHGITEKDVKNAPTFDAVYDELSSKIAGQITIHHTSFDKTAISWACAKYGLEILKPRWLDSAEVTKRAWEEFAYKGYRLANVARFLEISFDHHNALEDAFAAGQIVCRACEKTGLSVEEWLQRICQPIADNKSVSSTIKYDGNPEGPFYGEHLVFTGTLSLPRKEAAKLAADLGCKVSNSVSESTTMLVVGAQDLSRLASNEKSSKHRKVEELIKQGIPIEILSEDDFIEMYNSEITNE